jgi:tight adherence protein B
VSLMPEMYGAAVAASGLLLARAVAVASREGIQERLNYERDAVGPRRRPRNWLLRRLASRAERRGWPGAADSYGPALAGAAVAGAGLGAWLAGPVGAVAGLGIGPVAVETTLSRRAAATRARAEAQLRDAVAVLAASLRAGLSVRRALEEAARDGRPPLRVPLQTALSRMQVGESLEVALEDLAKTLDIPDLRLLVTALRVHARVGGDLPVLLDEVAAVIGHRVESRRQIRALTAQGRASGVVLAVLPIAFVALLSWTGGDGLGAFYGTPAGAGLLLAGLACDAAGFAWISRIVRPGDR